MITDIDRFRYDTSNFEQVVQGVQNKIGIHFETETRQVRTNQWQDERIVVGQDISGLLDMEIRERGPDSDLDVDTSGLHKKEHVDGHYDLRGLLRDDEGYIDVRINPELAGFGYPWGIDKRMWVSVLSSAAGINNVQQQLGRTPGKDAIKLMTTPGRKLYTPGEWLESFGDGLELGISDTSDWEMAEHDRQPFNHVQSWFATPTQILMTAAGRAREIKQTYGELIHLPKPDRPVEVDRFADALDTLNLFTRQPMAMMLELGNERLPKPPLHYVYNWVNARPQYYAWLFQNLGIIPAGFPSDEKITAQQAINKAFIVHIAKQCLQLDEIRPNAEVSSKTQAARTKMLQLAIEKYDVSA